MSPRDRQVQALRARLPGWYGPAVNRAVRFVMDGPAWLPRGLRRVPLRVLVLMAEVVHAAS